MKKTILNFKNTKKICDDILNILSDIEYKKLDDTVKFIGHDYHGDKNASYFFINCRNIILNTKLFDTIENLSDKINLSNKLLGSHIMKFEIGDYMSWNNFTTPNPIGKFLAISLTDNVISFKSESNEYNINVPKYSGIEININDIFSVPISKTTNIWLVLIIPSHVKL